MGHGLSPEQRNILLRAAQPPAPGTPPVVDLLARDAIEACYPGLQYQRSAYGETRCSAGVFPSQTPELRRARASISRSFRRLEERGLVNILRGEYSRWAGIKLTDEGRRAARHPALVDWMGGPPRPTGERLRRRALAHEEEARHQQLIEEHFNASALHP